MEEKESKRWEQRKECWKPSLR